MMQKNMDTSKNTSQPSLESDAMEQAIRILRDPPPPSEGAVTLTKRDYCFCGKPEEIIKMLMIQDTGIVKNVVSKVCRDCPNGARKQVSELFAIVCAGCKEVLIYGEPYKEKRSGFEWKAGHVYHVPNCPTCVGRVFKSSPVIEQKLFYKEHGIPYNDDGV